MHYPAVQSWLDLLTPWPSLACCIRWLLPAAHHLWSDLELVDPVPALLLCSGLAPGALCGLLWDSFICCHCVNLVTGGPVQQGYYHAGNSS